MDEITEKYRPQRDTTTKKTTDFSRYVTQSLFFGLLIFCSREETSEVRLRQVIENDAIDAKYGFERVRDNLERTGFLLNMHGVMNFTPGHFLYFCRVRF